MIDPVQNKLLSNGFRIYWGPQRHIIKRPQRSKGQEREGAREAPGRSWQVLETETGRSSRREVLGRGVEFTARPQWLAEGPGWRSQSAVGSRSWHLTYHETATIRTFITSKSGENLWLCSAFSLKAIISCSTRKALSLNLDSCNLQPLHW